MSLHNGTAAETERKRMLEAEGHIILNLGQNQYGDLEDRFVLDALESAFKHLTREYKIGQQEEAAPRTVQTDLFTFFPQEATA